MTAIADWAERPQPLQASDTVEEARRRFLDDSALCALPVVEDERPVGVLARSVVLCADKGDLTTQALACRLMATPMTMAADTPAQDALKILLAGESNADGVVVVEQGRYLGLITQTSLLRALQTRSEAERPTSEIRQRFVEMLGREIRTPMNGVLAVAELLQRQPLTADAQAYVQTMVDSTDSVLRLLDDALDLAMGETGRLEPKPAPLRVRELVDVIQSDWEGRESAGVAVLVSYDGDPDLGVLADGGRIRQVFSNLIGVAIKSTRQGAVEASLKARITAAGITLEGRIRDAGPGLPPDQLAHIFEPTAQEWSRAGWTGLGPALCRRIIEAMNGTIRAESNVGEGVTVTFDLIVPHLDLDAKDEDAHTALDNGRAIHVLVVDDNATNRMVAEGLCEMFDCTSECVEDGAEAVEAARSGRFDLILMDIKMPRMDGMEATRVIRALPGPVGQTPIIALTANADPDDAKTYLACGMCSVVEKPIKPERLLAAMNAALGGESAAVRAA